MWQEKREQIRGFWEKWGRQVFLLGAFLLVGVLSFEAGLLKKSLVPSESLVIETLTPLPPVRPVEKVKDMASPPTQASQEVAPASSPSSLSPTTDCAFVGSKNSNKYHFPSSHCAKQIKKENLVCFKDANDASSKGYVPGCLSP